jgi:hypothetical protein
MFVYTDLTKSFLDAAKALRRVSAHFALQLWRGVVQVPKM